MAIRFKCECGKTIRVAQAAAGKKGKCPSCGKVMLVPSASTQTKARDSTTLPEVTPVELNSISASDDMMSIINRAADAPVDTSSSQETSDEKSDIQEPTHSMSRSLLNRKNILISAVCLLGVGTLSLAGSFIGVSLFSSTSQEVSNPNNGLIGQKQPEESLKNSGDQNPVPAIRNISNSSNDKSSAKEATRKASENKSESIKEAALSSDAKLLEKLLDIHRDYYRRIVYHRAHVIDVRDGVPIQQAKQDKLVQLWALTEINPLISSELKSLLREIILFNEVNLRAHWKFVSSDRKNSKDFNTGIFDALGPKNDGAGLGKSLFGIFRQSALMKSLVEHRKSASKLAEELQQKWNHLVLSTVKDNPKYKFFAEDPEICTPLAGVFLPALEIPREELGVTYFDPFELRRFEQPAIINIGPHNKSWHYIFRFNSDEDKLPLNCELSGIQGDVCVRILISAGANQFSEKVNLNITGTPGNIPRIEKTSKYAEVNYQKAPFKHQFTIPHKAGYRLVVSHAHRPGMGTDFGNTGVKIRLWTSKQNRPDDNDTDVRIVSISGDPSIRAANNEKQILSDAMQLREKIALGQEIAGRVFHFGGDTVFFMKPKLNQKTGQVTGTITWIDKNPNFNEVSSFEGELKKNRFEFGEVKMIKVSPNRRKERYPYKSCYFKYVSNRHPDEAYGYRKLSEKSTSGRSITLSFNRTRLGINKEILTALQASKDHEKPISGASALYRSYPLKMTIKSVSMKRGTVSGEIHWTSLDSIHKFSGRVSKGIFTFKETSVVKKGKALTGTKYHLELPHKDDLHGSYFYTNGKRSQTGSIRLGIFNNEY